MSQSKADRYAVTYGSIQDKIDRLRSLPEADSVQREISEAVDLLAAAWSEIEARLRDA